MGFKVSCTVTVHTASTISVRVTDAGVCSRVALYLRLYALPRWLFTFVVRQVYGKIDVVLNIFVCLFVGRIFSVMSGTDWESKFSSIVRDTETNLERVKVFSSAILMGQQ